MAREARRGGAGHRLIGHHRTNAVSFSLIFFSISFGYFGVLLQEVAGILLALTELLALVGEPGTRLADEALIHAHVDQRALSADAFAVEDVGGDTLFLTTLTRVRLPTASVPSLSVSIRRTSRRIDA